MPGSKPAASNNIGNFFFVMVMKINSSLFLYLQEDYESMCILEDMYSMAANLACFEIVRNAGFNFH
jgi:hypothetical protein